MPEFLVAATTPPLRPLAPPVRATAPSPGTAALPPTWAGGAATPICPFPQPLGSPSASLVVARPQYFSLRPHGVLELFQLDLHLYLSSQWLRPHSHSAFWCPLFAPRPHPLLLQLCRQRGRSALPHPLVLFLSPLGRLTASLVVDRSQQFPLRPHGAMELFQLDLHLRLRSQWLRPHPHTSARRLRPWCTLPCKLRVYVYTFCIRYYSWNLFTPNYHRCTNQVFEKMQNIRRIITGMVACFCILGGFVSSSSRRARMP